jgi:hypothetical protein
MTVSKKASFWDCDSFYAIDQEGTHPAMALR